MSRDPRLSLADIQLSCSKIISYSEDFSRDEFFRDTMRFEAVLYNLHVLGEAVKNLPDELRERHGHISWRKIAGMRDIVAHAYFALDLDILWDAIRRSVPELSDAIPAVIQAESRR